VVTAHGPTVLRVCRALLGHHDAEDAAADALVAALEAYPRLRPDSDVRAWFVTIAHRKAVDVLRRQGRHAVPLARLPERPDGGEPVIGDEQLWQRVRALPPRQRDAVTCRYVGDLAYAQIAELLGVSEAAARRSAADGIASLRRHYPTAEESFR
jgi:RNA polymerase sigma factor (sigma-70 family)